MEITKQILEERLNLLNQEHKKLSDMQKIYEGAIQETTLWLKKIEEKDNEV